MTGIKRLQAFLDNYIWLILGDDGGSIVIDPGDATPVLSYLKNHQLKLSAILVTHHHADHSGGVGDLLRVFDVPVFGGHQEPIPHLSHPVKEGDKIENIIKGVSCRVIEIPGHTLGHVAFLFDHVGHIDHIEYIDHADHALSDHALFCGDTLFTAGCGRIFEGTVNQMWHSLQKLKNLPKDTLVYCGHEYTLQNLRFAEKVEPQNAKIQDRLKQVILAREKEEATVPSPMSLELETNPFLRTDSPTVKQAAEQHAGKPLENEIEIFAVIRQWKNSFS